MTIKIKLCALLAKLTHYLLKITRLGNGYTLPGKLCLYFYPSLLSTDSFSFSKGLIFISGTNGKTTTTKLLTDVLRSHSYSVITNMSGSNLERGLVTSLLLGVRFSLTKGFTFKYDFGVFELDELVLGRVLARMLPDVLCLLNISRDQLDRYGEPDLILTNWASAITTGFQTKPQNHQTVIYDQTDDLLVTLCNTLSLSDMVTCVPFDATTTFLQLTKLKGTFNAKNINCVQKVAAKYGITKAQFELSIKNVTHAYGRGELIKYKGKSFLLHLAKNPASFEHNLDLIKDDMAPETAVVLILNNNIPDGKDVSWIYDIPQVKLAYTLHGFQTIYVSGTRCLDMAVRLHYCGIDVPPEHINPHLKSTLTAIVANPLVKRAVVLPNYSAMLACRKLLLGKSIL